MSIKSYKQTNKLSERRWGVRTHLDEELSVLLDVLVSRLLLLFLLRLHRDVDVHSQLLTARQEQHEVNERPASRLWDSLLESNKFLTSCIRGKVWWRCRVWNPSRPRWRSRPPSPEHRETDGHRKNPKHQWQKYKITNIFDTSVRMKVIYYCE